MNASTTATSTRCSPPLRARRLALAALAALAVGACTGGRDRGERDGADRDRAERGRADREVEAPPAPVLPQFNLAVAEIQVIPAYAPGPGTSAEQAVPFAPKAALETWAKTHVRARGRTGTAAIVIRDASISAKKVPPRTANWRDWFRRQPVERYDAVLELELQIKDDAGRIRAQTVARAAHARFLMDDHRDYQRERTTQLQALTDEIIAAALKRLEGEVRTNLARWVR
jgi:hypothetical protein